MAGFVARWAYFTLAILLSHTISASAELGPLGTVVTVSVVLLVQSAVARTARRLRHRCREATN